MAEKRPGSPLDNHLGSSKVQKTSNGKNEQKAARPFATTFRISDIDATISKEELYRHVEETFLSGEGCHRGERAEIVRLSLAPSPTDQGRYQVAVVTLNRVPLGLVSCFQEQKPQKLQIPSGNRESKAYYESTFIGLTPLNDSGNVVFDVDLIFVTGLAGHAFGSWKESNGYTMWIRDFLLDDIEMKQPDFPRVRILTYGYDSRLQSSNSTAGIRGFAQGLLESMTNSRELPDQQERPIVFVAHSLGGIVVKKALAIAARGTDNQQKILRATYSLIFLGVPNRGMDNEKLSQMVKGQPNEALILDLGHGSESLRSLQETFSSVVALHNIQMISVYETRLTESLQYSRTGGWTRSGKSTLMVPRESATHSCHTEASCDQLSRDVNHSAISKFSTRDQDYINLSRSVFDCISKSVEAVPRRFSDGSAGLATTVVPIDKFFQLPFGLKFAKNANFTGREDLLRIIHEKIKHRVSKEIVLSGLGGTGKTQIALEYVWRYHHSFTSIFWINGLSEETTVQGFRGIANRLVGHYALQTSSASLNYARIAVELGLNGLIDDKGELSPGLGSDESIILSVKRWLSLQDNQEWLLVIDNVDDLESFKINSFIPTCSHGAIITTSRRRRVDWQDRVIELNEMNPAEALQLLLRIARRKSFELVQDGKLPPQT